MWTVIFDIIKEALGFAKGITENQALKIPLKTKEIAQRSENKAGELKEDGIKDDALPALKTFLKGLKPLKRLKAKTGLKRHIDGGATIIDIDEKKFTFQYPGKEVQTFEY